MENKKTLKKLSEEYQTLIEEVTPTEEPADSEQNAQARTSKSKFSRSQTKGNEGLEAGEILENNEAPEEYAITFEAERARQADETEITLEGLNDFYKMRRSWSILLMISLVIIIVFNILLIILVGNGLLIFQDEWFLRIVLTTNLGEIIGLIWLVVKFLFTHPPIRSEAGKKV